MRTSRGPRPDWFGSGELAEEVVDRLGVVRERPPLRDLAVFVDVVDLSRPIAEALTAATDRHLHEGDRVIVVGNDIVEVHRELDIRNSTHRINHGLLSSKRVSPDLMPDNVVGQPLSHFRQIARSESLALSRQPRRTA